MSDASHFPGVQSVTSRLLLCHWVSYHGDLEDIPLLPQPVVWMLDIMSNASVPHFSGVPDVSSHLILPLSELPWRSRGHSAAIAARRTNAHRDSTSATPSQNVTHLWWMRMVTIHADGVASSARIIRYWLAGRLPADMPSYTAVTARFVTTMSRRLTLLLLLITQVCYLYSNNSFMVFHWQLFYHLWGRDMKISFLIQFSGLKIS